MNNDISKLCILIYLQGQAIYMAIIYIYLKLSVIIIRPFYSILTHS